MGPGGVALRPPLYVTDTKKRKRNNAATSYVAVKSSHKGSSANAALTKTCMLFGAGRGVARHTSAICSATL